MLFNTIETIYKKFGEQPTYWVAYSGGLDSHVLLHLLVNLRSLYPIKLKAIHINHSMSPNAKSWSKHCEKICKTLDVKLTQQTIAIPQSTGESLEDLARELRYEIFKNLLKKNDLLLTAHHKDDQAETILLQLFRGAGPKGLSGMPKEKVFGQGIHLRPLLGHSRKELQAYANKNNLTWVEDESNFNINFTRNFIRHEIISTLKSRWPNVENMLVRSAENCAEAQHILNDLAAKDLSEIVGFKSSTLNIKKLLLLSPERQRLVIRFWLQQLKFPIPNSAKLLQVQNDILHAKEDKMPHIVWQNTALRRYQDLLYVMQCLPLHNAFLQLKWDFKNNLSIPNVGELQAKLVVGKGFRTDLNNITVRFRQGGEVCRLPGRKFHHELKKLFQDWHVPTWERDRIPLIFCDDKLISVVGYFIDEAFQAEGNQMGYEVLFIPLSSTSPCEEVGPKHSE